MMSSRRRLLAVVAPMGAVLCLIASACAPDHEENFYFTFSYGVPQSELWVGATFCGGHSFVSTYRNDGSQGVRASPEFVRVLDATQDAELQALFAPELTGRYHADAYTGCPDDTSRDQSIHVYSEMSFFGDFCLNKPMSQESQHFVERVLEYVRWTYGSETCAGPCYPKESYACEPPPAEGWPKI